MRGAEITPAVDVYALGLVLLECLAGHREYEGAEIEAPVAPTTAWQQPVQAGQQGKNGKGNKGKP